MTLTQIRHFIGLAKAGSFVKASSQLFMTQPALSRSIKALEDELGQLLFDRAGKKSNSRPMAMLCCNAAKRCLRKWRRSKAQARFLAPQTPVTCDWG